MSRRGIQARPRSFSRWRLARQPRRRDANALGQQNAAAGAAFRLDLPALQSLVIRGMEGEMLKGHLDMIVLAALSAGSAHGYAIIEEIRRRSRGAFDLPEGTIYPALHRLEQTRQSRTRRTPRGLGTVFRGYWGHARRSPAVHDSDLISGYVDKLARELEFDRSLSVCVRQEVDD